MITPFLLLKPDDDTCIVYSHLFSVDYTVRIEHVGYNLFQDITPLCLMDGHRLGVELHQYIIIRLGCNFLEFRENTYRSELCMFFQFCQDCVIHGVVLE
jgi:hypothetical protein